jgi:hypothetical protein
MTRTTEIDAVQHAHALTHIDQNLSQQRNNMDILDNFESAWDTYPEGAFDNLSQKLFSEAVCKECESKPMIETDNMGREKFWEDLGRP